jgi:hypothetical protein
MKQFGVTGGPRRRQAAFGHDVFCPVLCDRMLTLWPAMRYSEWDFNDGIDEPDAPWPDSEEERVDRFGIIAAALVLCIAVFIAALWLRLPSFQNCSALEHVADRNACYDMLKNDLSKPPAKGPDIPKS